MAEYPPLTSRKKEDANYTTLKKEPSHLSAGITDRACPPCLLFSMIDLKKKFGPVGTDGSAAIAYISVATEPRRLSSYDGNQYCSIAILHSCTLGKRINIKLVLKFETQLRTYVRTYSIIAHSGAFLLFAQVQHDVLSFSQICTLEMASIRTW